PVKQPEKQPEKSGTIPKGGKTAPSHKHSWSNWETKSEATVFAAELQTRSCSECKETEEKSVGKALAPTMKTNAANDKISIKKGSSTSLFYIGELAAGDSIKSVTSSSNKVVKVTAVKSKPGYYKLKAGKLTGKKGKAVITITLASGLTKKISVTVVKGKVKTSSVKAEETSISLKKGKTMNLKAMITVEPFTSSDKLTFTSSSKKIVTVSKKGVLKAKKAGKAKITVKAGKKKLTIKVTVTK
ncbi:MAG: Ig-like domain-containing protein, partial [Eubacteriales bacterium]|nr:Ig-like domain-containing protein [Eubacteriales bacterium]